MRTTALIAAALCIATLPALTGCASRANADAVPAFSVPAGAYTAAFDAARAALRDEGYTLDRVDARAGVITTRPRVEPAIAPSGAAGDADSWWNSQRSVARVEFAPEDREPSGATDHPDTDLRADDAPMQARVIVTIERLQRPGRRIEPVSIRLSSIWNEPGWEDRAMQPGHTTVQRRDQTHAATLARRIQERITPNIDHTGE
ncbi:MAG: hypothetical protein EA379_05880 [Phycisphaerales bacterium]|nr:MAG: hypothetical protein EA379_05880 [Phycisphaerales bacterium]